MSLPWYKWYQSTWLASETRHSMSLAERGLYRDCLDLHYSEGSIPADTTVLRRALGIDREDFEGPWEKVSKCFLEDPNDATRLHNKKASFELQKLSKYSEKQSQNGHLGGLARAESNSSGSKVDSKRSLGDGKATAKRRPGDGLANKNKNKNKTSPLPPKGESWGDRFAEWWDLWPKKTAKPDARKAYLKLVVDGKAKPEQRDDLAPYPDFESRHAQLVKATEAWAPDFARRDIDKVPYPATFLNRLDWLSAPANSNSANGAPSHAEAIAKYKRTKLSIDGPNRMAWETTTQQWHERLRKLGWPIPS